MAEKRKRINELEELLNEASRAYYQESREIMSNFEYDKLYDELTALEEETGTIFAGSPTQKVGYEVLSELPKERHERPMLSLNKTKSVDELKEWLGSQKGLLSWKMDGLTVVLTYEDGKLAKAVTRGNGEIGEVRKVEAFTDRPIWPQGLETPEEVHQVPDTLNWEAFIGPAKMRPYNNIYTPWNFRGWWDYGTGALGDMACHILHSVFKGLNLKYPTKVQGTSTLLLNDSCPQAQKVKMTFPARDNMPKVAMPEVEVHWYDGGLIPERPANLPQGRNLNVSGGGAIFYGSKDTMVIGCYGEKPYLLSGRVPNAPKVLREVTLSHQQDWIRACKEDPSVRVPSASDFAEAGPFNEMVVMGVLAVRLQSLNMELHWDGEKMEFTNIPEDAKIRSVIKDGFTIKDGHPTFKKTYTDPVNAREFAKELIQHTYHNGYKLPDMPTE